MTLFRRRLLLLLAMMATTTTAWIQCKTRHFLTRRCVSSLSLTMMLSTTPTLLSVDECLSLQQDDDAVVFVDGTWFHKGNRVGRQEFEQGPRIRGARHIDMTDLCASHELYPSLNPKKLYAMLPPPELFSAFMDEYNITNTNHVIVYGSEGAYFTSRTWFLFQHFGHSNVSLMQGSLQEWMEKGGPVDTDPVTVPRAKDVVENARGKTPCYKCTVRKNVVDFEQMKKIVDDQQTIIIDPRGSSFANGHVTGAKHVPYSSLVKDESTLKLKPKEELLDIFAKAGLTNVNTDQDIVASCGSGVSACSIILALEACGRTNDKNTYLYDGSWQEWKLDPDTPKVLPLDEQ